MRGVIPSAQRAQIPDTILERREVVVVQPSHRVRRVARSRQWCNRHEHVGSARSRFVVQALERLDPAVGPVRQQHERERRAVVVDGPSALPEQPPGWKSIDRLDQRVVFAVLLPRVGLLVGRIVVRPRRVLVPGLVPRGPVRDEPAVREVEHQTHDHHHHHHHGDRCVGDDAVGATRARRRELVRLVRHGAAPTHSRPNSELSRRMISAAPTAAIRNMQR